jgi:hypothetical protein
MLSKGACETDDRILIPIDRAHTEIQIITSLRSHASQLLDEFF